MMSNAETVPMKIRLKYFVYPQFQSALLLANAVVNLFLFTFFSVRVRIFFESLFKAGKSAGLQEGHIYFQFIDIQKANLKFEFGIAIFISLTLTSILTLWLSHRIAGPLVRLRDHLKSTAEKGVYQTLEFREKDYFQDLPGYLNSAIESIKKHDSK